MKRKILAGAAFALALVGIAVYSYYQEPGAFGLIGAGTILFGVTIGFGIIWRLIRAKRGHKFREAFGPVAGAADAYQTMMLSQPTGAAMAAEASKGISSDKFHSGS